MLSSDLGGFEAGEDEGLVVFPLGFLDGLLGHDDDAGPLGGVGLGGGEDADGGLLEAVCAAFARAVEEDDAGGCVLGVVVGGDPDGDFVVGAAGGDGALEEGGGFDVGLRLEVVGGAAGEEGEEGDDQDGVEVGRHNER